MNATQKNRILIIFFVFCFFYALIIFVLYLIQVHQHSFYTNLAQRQYRISITQQPPRAPIFDRNNNLLALNKESFSAFILPKQLEDPEKTCTFLAQNFPAAYQRLTSHADAHFIFVKRRLTPAEQQIIERAHCSDIKLVSEPSRFYPVESTGPLIGITDIDNNGLFGLELQYNALLAGQPTTYSLEKDARSKTFYFKKETTKKGTLGSPVITTIDSDLQFLVHEAVQETIATFEAQEAGALVMDPQSGDILAMVTLPNFNPNKPIDTHLEQTKNKIITESYELGSVIKVCAALAALEEGVVTPDELIDCENKQTTLIDGRRVNTTPSTEAGIIPFSRVLQKSNNIGIAKVAMRLGEKIYNHYRRLGFGEKTGITFPGEQKGYINPPATWSRQSIFSLSYGYEIAGTILQIARAFSIIANGGFAVRPRLVLSPAPAQKTPERLYTSKSIDALKAIIDSDKRSGRVPRVPGCRVMSKTGTANLLEGGSYNPEKNIFSCAGIIEQDAKNYRRVIVVYVKEIKHKKLLAARVASPLLATIAKKTAIHDAII